MEGQKGICVICGEQINEWLDEQFDLDPIDYGYVFIDRDINKPAHLDCVWNQRIWRRIQEIERKLSLLEPIG